MVSAKYDKNDVVTLSWLEQLRLRPGMYIGEIGDGSGYHDCVYLLLKEIVDNAVDEFIMGAGRQVDVTVDYKSCEMCVRDYGRGVPIGTLADCVGTMNTSAKYKKRAFQFSAGMNGVGSKAVNALSAHFEARTVRGGQYEEVVFEKGVLSSKRRGKCDAREHDGTRIAWCPDTSLLPRFTVREEHVVRRIRMYAYVNPGLKFVLNGSERCAADGCAEMADARRERRRRGCAITTAGCKRGNHAMP